MSIHKDCERRRWSLGADAEDERVTAALDPIELVYASRPPLRSPSLCHGDHFKISSVGYRDRRHRDIELDGILVVMKYDMAVSMFDPDD